MNVRIDAIYLSREQAARQDRVFGGKVVGVLGATVPVELITAAGMLPVRLVGDPDPALSISRPFMEPIREGYLRSICEKLLAGVYDGLDLLVIPRSSEGLLQFYYVLQHIRESRPDYRLPDIHLFDLLQTPFEYTRAYVKDRLSELKRKLENVSQRSISDAQIHAAIVRHNDARRLFRIINERRRMFPPELDGETLLKLACCGQSLPVDVFADLLGKEPAGSRPDGKRRARLMVKGSPIAHAPLYRQIEAAGSVIVADDHEWGEGLYAYDVDSEAPWADALADHYMVNVPGPRRLPQRRVDMEALERAKNSKANGVVFLLEENDDTLGWDYPAQKEMFEQHGIATLLLTRQIFGMLDRASLQAVEAFIGEIGS